MEYRVESGSSLHNVIIMQHCEMKLFEKHIQWKHDVSSVLYFVEKSHITHISFFKQKYMLIIMLRCSTLSFTILRGCELTQDVFFTGSFPTAMLSHYLH